MDVPVMWECLKQNNQWVSLGKDISKHIEDYFQQKVVSCEYTDASDIRSTFVLKVRRTGPGLQEFNKMEKAKLITNWTDVAVQDLSKHEKCSICLCEFHDDMEDDEDDEDEQIVHLSRCGPHYYHRDCILNCYVPPQDSDRLVHDGHLKCPICAFSYGIRTGRMPFGTMEVSRYNQSLPSYEGYGIIQIIYSFPPGVQGPEHPAPGTLYTGTVRKCFLPNNDEGRAVLQKLEIAFQRRLTFVVGTSITSGRDNTVVWNGIHHKTNLYGGPARYGYPDPTYLFRVSEELANVGIL